MAGTSFGPKTIRIDGLAELSKALKDLNEEVAGKGGGPLRYAILQAAKVIKAQAIANAPRRTGRLKLNIVTARMRNTPRGREGYFVEVRRKRKHYANTRFNRRHKMVGKTYDVRDAYYGMFLEFGTQKMAARPFMRPAFEQKKQEAALAFLDAFKRAIEMAARRAYKRRGGR